MSQYVRIRRVGRRRWAWTASTFTSTAEWDDEAYIHGASSSPITAWLRTRAALARMRKWNS